MSETKSDIRSYYDKLEDYSKGYSSKAGLHFKKRKIVTFLQLAGTHAGPILEVGCADGPYTLELASMGFTMIGLDLSQKQLERLKSLSRKSNLKNVDVVLGDAEHLPFRSTSFNMVISISTVRYVPNPKEAIKEFSRTTAMRGSVIVDFPNKYSPYFLVLKRLLMVPHPHDRHFSTIEVMQLFSAARLSQVSCRIVLITPKDAPDFLLPLIRLLERIIEATPFTSRLASIIVCAGRKTQD